MTTVKELIRELEGMDQDAEVRIAHQPRWPLEYSIGQTVEVTNPDEDDEEEAEVKDKPAKEPETVVYIGEGNQLGYLGSNASRSLGWGRN